MQEKITEIRKETLIKNEKILINDQKKCAYNEKNTQYNTQTNIIKEKQATSNTDKKSHTTIHKQYTNTYMHTYTNSDNQI